jgi:hypothetical protein
MEMLYGNKNYLRDKENKTDTMNYFNGLNETQKKQYLAQKDKPLMDRFREIEKKEKIRKRKGK